MQATAQIISKLRNARFQPPNGGPREKLAFINRGEADLLRAIGGAGKKTRLGVPTFYDTNINRDPNGPMPSGMGAPSAVPAQGKVSFQGSNHYKTNYNDLQQPAVRSRSPFVGMRPAAPLPFRNGVPYAPNAPVAPPAYRAPPVAPPVTARPSWQPSTRFNSSDSGTHDGGQQYGWGFNENRGVVPGGARFGQFYGGTDRSGRGGFGGLGGTMSGQGGFGGPNGRRDGTGGRNA